MKSYQTIIPRGIRNYIHPLAVLSMTLFFTTGLSAQESNNNHLELSAGALYERGFDATIAYEHETDYHNAWEYFVSGYLKYDTDPKAGHVTRSSFWNNYKTYHIGIAYKPCVVRGRNNHGNLRIGVSGGSDRSQFIAGIHVGYEHSYTLSNSCELFWQVREDVIFRGRDLFRTGAAAGIKFSL